MHVSLNLGKSVSRITPNMNRWSQYHFAISLTYFGQSHCKIVQHFCKTKCLPNLNIHLNKFVAVPIQDMLQHLWFVS